jgi:group II intron reverse transcriptase/maturase
MLLEAVYEPHFHACSHGFRRGHSAHQAVSSLRDQCLKLGIHWIMDADLAKFFDTIAPLHLRAILQKRVRDGVVRRLIGRWLQVGVLEAGKVVRSEMGTPQGGVISPSLANIFLHTVLDEWFETTVRPRLGGNCLLVRFADDFGMGFTCKRDAEKVFRVRPKRFERYGLKIHPEKSRLVQFSRPLGRRGQGPGTFAFLGFDHYWGKTQKGGWTIKRKTHGKRLRRFLSGIHEWCRKHRHLNMVEQYPTLKSKLRGHYKLLEVAYAHAERVWKRWLSRRSSKHRLNWEQWMVRGQAICPLAQPRIVHAF